jgi:N utilization substance protein B
MSAARGTNLNTASQGGTTARRRAREFALQGLYQRQLSGTPADVIGNDLTASHGFGRADREYFAALWPAVALEWDALIVELAPHLDRAVNLVSPIERAILVVGTWELKHRTDIPYRVIIDEAVELAKSYGGTDGHKFVNGVLDKLAPRLRAEEAKLGSEL